MALAVVDVVYRLSELRRTPSIEALAESVGVKFGQVTSEGYRGSAAISRSGGTAALVRSDLDPDADPDGYLYGRVVVFTGKLTSMTRQVAWDECSKVGATSEATTTKRTNVLVIGDINPLSLRPGSEWTGKARKAFELQGKGQQIEVMTEDDYLKCLEGNALTTPATDARGDAMQP